MQQPGGAGGEAGADRHAYDLARAFIGCRGCPANLLCMQQLVVRWFDAWQAAERGRFVLSLPVFMGAGVAAYFGLRIEPPVFLGPVAALPAVAASCLLKHLPRLQA